MSTPRHAFTALTLALITTSTPGCLGNVTSIFRDFDIEKGESISIDANQRVVLAGRVTDSYGTTWIRACAEPSPDVFSVIGSSLAGKGSAASKVSAEFAATLSQSGSNIGLRTQAIQLLRDSMYRLCEGYLSGALTEGRFAGLQRRYQNIMLGLLAIEQLTGVTTPPQVVLKGTPLADESKDVAEIDATLTQLRGEQEDAMGELKEARRTEDSPAHSKETSPPPEGETSTPGTPVARAQRKLDDKNRAVRRVEQLRDQALKGHSPSGDSTTTIGRPIFPSSTRPPLDEGMIDKLGKHVLDIVTTIVKADYTDEACMDFFQDNGFPTPQQAEMNIARTGEPSHNPGKESFLAICSSLLLKRIPKETDTEKKISDEINQLRLLELQRAVGKKRLKPSDPSEKNQTPQ